MTDLRAAARQALEALEESCTPRLSTKHYAEYDAAITALKAALEQPEQEPVAWMMVNKTHNLGPSLHWKPQTDWHITWEAVPLYTHQPRREWQGLTDTERAAVQHESFKRGLSPLEFMELHEAKLKEKNRE